MFTPAEELGMMHFSSENFSTALEYFHEALKATENSADPDKFRILLRIFDCHRNKGNVADAGRALDQANKLAEGFPSDEVFGRIEHRRAHLMITAGELDGALKEAFSAYRKLKKTDAHGEVGRIQNLIGYCYARIGLLSESEEFYTDALSSFRRVEDRAGIAYAYNNLGLLHKNACRWSRSLASLSKALDIAKTLGLTQPLILVQLNMGVVNMKVRRFVEAIGSFKTSAENAERFGDQFNLVKGLGMLGRTYIRVGEYAKAEKLILRVSSMAEELGYAREVTLADEYLGELMIARGKYQDALTILRKVLKNSRRIAPQGDLTAECLRRVADVELALDRPQEALDHIKEGLEIATTCGELYEIGYFYRTQGLCWSRLGERQKALESLESSIKVFEQYENRYEKAVSGQILARLLIRNKEESSLLKAKHVLAEGIADFSRLEDGTGQIVSQILLASVEQRLDNLDDALLAVYEADRIVDEEGNDKFRRALVALRNKIESKMTRASTRVLDQFSVLGDMQVGARSRDNLVKGLSSTLKLILDKLGAQSGFVAIPNTKGKSLQIVTRDGIARAEAQAILSWYKGAFDSDKPARSGVLITDLENKPEVEALRVKLDDPAGALLLQGLGFEEENLGVLCVRQGPESNRPPMGQEALHFVGAYSSLVSLSVYEIVRSERRDQTRAQNASKGFQSIVTDNKEMIKLLNLSERVAHSDATVLLQGETGTGKGLIAYAVHLLSDRRERKFMHVNCAAMPEQLLESELFGHVRGAFTGAFAEKEGLLREADGGTVFLDEISKTSLAMQGKLLHFLDTNKVRKVGSNDLISVDVRVICASKGNLLQMCNEGTFLEDFFYRINDFPLTVPPLRDRLDDVTLLMYHYVDKISREMGKDIDGVTDEFLENLRSYRWPGNVRELEKVVKRAIILADDGDKLSLDHLAPEVMESSWDVEVESDERDDDMTLKERLERLEQVEIHEALKRHEWNKSQAAIHLGISYPNLLSKIKRYNIQ
jgi:transcriptional regulator with GAF, ATPase, and Fis domain